MENKLDKEQIFKLCINMIGDSISINNDQRKNILYIMTRAFEDIDLIQTKNELSTEAMNNEIVIKNYLGCLKIKGRRESTIDAYKVSLNQLCKFYKKDILKITTNELRRILMQYEDKVSPTTADNFRRNLNSFYEFCVEEEYISKNPVKRIGIIKTGNNYKKFYTDLEMETMRDNCRTKREIALVDFLLSTGLRVSEVSNVRLNEIDWDERTVVVHGKGNKDRVVPFSIRAKKHLIEYIDNRDMNSQYLFCGEKNTTLKLKRNSISNIIKIIGKRSNLPNITVHCFRRWLATDLCNKGVEPQIIQSILGHSSFNTTLNHYCANNISKTIYTHGIFVS